MSKKIFRIFQIVVILAVIVMNILVTVYTYKATHKPQPTDVEIQGK